MEIGEDTYLELSPERLEGDEALMTSKQQQLMDKAYYLRTGHTVTSTHWKATKEEVNELTYLVCKGSLPSIKGIRMGAHYTKVDFQNGTSKDLEDLTDNKIIGWGNTPEEAWDMAYSKLQ